MAGVGWGGGGLDEESQKVQTSSFKIGIRDVQNDKYNQHCWMLQMKVVKRANYKSSYHKKKIFSYFFNSMSIWDEACSLNLLW